MFDRIKEGRWWDQGWQLIEGCTEVSEACDHCWSLEKEKRFKIGHGLDHQTAQVRFVSSRLDRPMKRNIPTVYAIWNDLFHESVTFEQIDQVMTVISLCPQHIFLILTKRSKRMLEYFDRFYLNPRIYIDNHITRFYYKSKKIHNYSINTKPFLYESSCVYSGPIPFQNIWLGVTCESSGYYDRIIDLMKIPAAIHFLSIEPMFDFIDLFEIAMYKAIVFINENETLFPIDWIIAGGETGTKAKPLNPTWLTTLYTDCKINHIPFFFKSWGEYVTYNHLPEFYINQLKKGTAKHKIMNYQFFAGGVTYTFHKIGRKNAGNKIFGKSVLEMPDYRSYLK